MEETESTTTKPAIVEKLPLSVLAKSTETIIGTNVETIKAVKFVPSHYDLTRILAKYFETRYKLESKIHQLWLGMANTPEESDETETDWTKTNEAEAFRVELEILRNLIIETSVESSASAGLRKWVETEYAQDSQRFKDLLKGGKVSVLNPEQKKALFKKFPQI